MVIFRKVESLVFYLFIFCVPLQVRIILVKWPVLRILGEGGAPIYVGFNEWTSAFLQVTDVLILALLLLWLIRWLQGLKSRQQDGGVPTVASGFSKADIFLGIFFLISAISITASDFRSLSGYQLIKLAEFILFYFYIKSNLGRVFQWEKLLEMLVLSGAVQAVIGIIQYTTQSALGLRFLSESPITPGGEGVASFYVGSKVFLRAYGLMPHPNILAVFLMLAIFAFYYLYFNGIRVAGITYQVLRIRNNPIPNTRYLILALLIYSTMLYALFATYSRTVIGLMVLAMVVFLAIQVWQVGVKFLLNKKVYTIAIVSFAVVLLFLSLNFHQAISRALISSSDEAVSLRIFYDKFAGQTTGHYPWFGVGIGAFVPKLMQTLSHIPIYYYQPVHNIYLLVSSETGILGIGSFLVFLLFLIKKHIIKSSLSTTTAVFGISSPEFILKNEVLLKDPNKLGLLLVCLTLLSIGLFDHLLWTIQQGRIIFWLVLAVVASRPQ